MKSLIKTAAWLSIAQIILSIITFIVMISTAEAWKATNYYTIFGKDMSVLLFVLNILIYIPIMIISIIILANYKGISKGNLGVIIAACICSFGIVIPLLGFFLSIATTTLFMVVILRENQKNLFQPNQDKPKLNPPNLTPKKD